MPLKFFSLSFSLTSIKFASFWLSEYLSVSCSLASKKDLLRELFLVEGFLLERLRLDSEDLRTDVIDEYLFGEICFSLISEFFFFRFEEERVWDIDWSFE